MTRVVLALVAALVPGLAAWWTGRALVRHADDPALPELLLARQQRLTAIAAVAGVAVALLSAWALPVLVVALLVGGGLSVAGSQARVSALQSQVGDAQQDLVAVERLDQEILGAA